MGMHVIPNTPYIFKPVCTIAIFWYIMCVYIFYIKVREGSRAAYFPNLCVFLDYTAVSEHV